MVLYRYKFEEEEFLEEFIDNLNEKCRFFKRKQKIDKQKINTIVKISEGIKPTFFMNNGYFSLFYRNRRGLIFCINWGNISNFYVDHTSPW